MSRHLPAGVPSLILALFTAFSFAIIAESVVQQRALTRFDEQQAERCFHFAAARPTVWNGAVYVTNLGGGQARIVVITIVTLFLIIEHELFLLLLWLLMQWGVRECIPMVKLAFDRHRPCWNDEVCQLGDPSFPSGHACGALALYGMVAYLILLRCRTSRWRWPVVGILAALVLLIGLSRMLLGVHYFSDVIAGFLLGLTWLALMAALMSRFEQWVIRKE